MTRYHRAALHLLGGLMAGLLSVSLAQFALDAVRGGATPTVTLVVHPN